MSTVDIGIERFIIHFISLGKKSLELLGSEAIRDIRFSVMTLFHPPYPSMKQLKISNEIMVDI